MINIMSDHIDRQLRSLTESISFEATLEIIELFFTDTPEKLEALNKAIDQKDCKTAQQLAHQLKSSSGYLGLSVLQKILEEVEIVAQEKEPLNLIILKQPMNLIYEESVKYLKAYLKEIDPCTKF